MTKRGSTRQALIAAVWALSEEKSFRDVTVKEIAERCNVSERTFYNYFRDKYDLVVQEMSQTGREFFNRMVREGTFYEYLFSVTSAMKEERSDYMASVNRYILTDSMFQKRFYDHSMDFYAKHIREHLIEGDDYAKLKYEMSMWTKGMLSQHATYYAGLLDIPLETQIAWEVDAIPEACKPYFDFPALREKRSKSDKNC